MQNKSADGEREANWSIVGHEWAVTLLQNAVTGRQQAHAYLFTGVAHIGRYTLARALARALNCTAGQSPCAARVDGGAWKVKEGCRACRLIAAGAHPDVEVLSPEGASLKIDQVRQLQHDVALLPVEARWRVAIIDGMEAATAEASNALLKTLEEPPSHVVLVLIASEAGLLLPTIVSRCQHLPLRPLTIGRVQDALMTHWHVETQRANELAHLSGGRLGWAVMAAQDATVLEKRASRLDDLLRLVGEKRAGRFAYAEAISMDSNALLETLDVWEAWWRDVLLLAAGSRAPLTNVDRLSALDQHAHRFGAGRARQILTAIVRTRHQLTLNANARLALEVLMLDLPFA